MRNSRGQLCRRVGKSAKIIQSKLVNFVRCIAVVVVVVVTELREHNLVAFACVLIMFSIVMMMMTNIIMCWATKQFSFEEVACNYAQIVDVCVRVCVCTNTYLLL